MRQPSQFTKETFDSVNPVAWIETLQVADQNGDLKQYKDAVKSNLLRPLYIHD